MENDRYIYYMKSHIFTNRVENAIFYVEQDKTSLSLSK